jgi:hypothetical protein
MDTLDCIRAQRAEVEALLAWRHAAEGEAKRVAWWRLQRCRRARLPLLGEAERARLPPLPPPPAGALGRWQALRMRLGLLALDRAAPPPAIARRLGPGNKA